MLALPPIKLMVAPLLLGIVGCHHFGPSTIVSDRIPYNNAIATSWQQQTLLNIVKSRYGDTPFLVDVSQVIAGYQEQHSLSADAGVAATAAVLAPPMTDRLTGRLGLASSYSDRPTISYTPQTGSKFIRNMTGPVEPGAVLFMIQAGYPADLMLELVVDSINGIQNFSTASGESRQADPRFRRILQIMKHAQESASVGMRIERDKESKETVVFMVRDKNIEPTLERELAELRSLLGLDQTQKEFKVVYGATATQPNEIAILTRSIFRMYTVLSSFVDAPTQHVIEGRATPSEALSSCQDEPFFQVHSGLKPPEDCFTAVNYRGHWFWVDDRSFYSKRIFSFLLAFQSLADTGTKEGLPVVTIQAN